MLPDNEGLFDFMKFFHFFGFMDLWIEEVSTVDILKICHSVVVHAFPIPVEFWHFKELVRFSQPPSGFLVHIETRSCSTFCDLKENDMDAIEPLEKKLDQVPTILEG